MSTSSDFNMLRLEAPRDLLQIEEGSAPTENAVEVVNPAVWVRTLARQQRQAEEDMQRLIEACGDTVDRTDRRIQRVEQAYHDLTEGTRYVYDRMNANEEVAEAWIRSELAVAANAYQTFAQNVWAAIIERTDEAAQQQIGQATQLARINDALAFHREADIARNQHLATFQGNVELWAKEHQAKVSYLEEQLSKTQEAVRRVATMVPAPASPPKTWRSPARPPSTSLPESQTQRLVLGSPFQPAKDQTELPQRRLRPPAVPQTPPSLRGPLAEPTRRPPSTPRNQPTGNAGGPPPVPPRNRFAGGAGSSPSDPASSPSIPPSPPQHRVPFRPIPRSPPNPRPVLTTEELVQIVAEGVARAQPTRERQEGGLRTSRLKMTNPESFDGKPGSSFNTWWKSVVKYLGFYPDTEDRQKIAWVGTLLTGTAKAWDLHRYDTLGEADNWFNYSAAIRTEYLDPREAANAQLKLGQLKYAGDIRAYFTEFRALNNYARATGEGLQEKVDLAMTTEILRMRFAHYLGEFADDEGFLAATYQAGLQVERMKALEKAREASGHKRAETGNKDGQRRKGPDNVGRAGKTEQTPRPAKIDTTARTKNPYGKAETWGTKEAALKGVPEKEKEEYGKSWDDCWRCGRSGHKTYECYAFTTRNGTALPPAPWKVAATTQGKRKRSEEPEEPSATKQQKVAAVEEMVTDLPLWADSGDSDF